MTASLGMLIAALSGFVALSYEILWYRMFSVASGGTAPVFAFVLGAYLCGLAAGGLFVRFFSRHAGSDDPRAVALLLSAFIGGANAVGYSVIPVLGTACAAGVCLAALPVVVVAAALLGAIFPLVCHGAIPADHLAGL
ncbi:MAG: hypothetical protein ACREU7_05605, partial [Burkholderiales bacterium]